MVQKWPHPRENLQTVLYEMAQREGLEPSTPWSEAKCSIH